MCNGLETGQCIREWCAACEWPAERPTQLREWLDCVRDLSVADDADISTIASRVSTSFLGKKAFRERVRVLAARIERGEDPYDRAPPKTKPPPKRAAAPPKRKPAKKKPPARATKRRAPSSSSSESESEDERPPRRAAAKAAAKKAPPAKKKKKPVLKKKTKVYADKDLLLRPTYVAKAAAEFEGQAEPRATKGRCARCDGLHRTEACPHFSKPRERVVQASVSSTRVAAVRTGIAGTLEQVVVDDAPGRPPQLPGSAKGEARPTYPFTAPAARGGLEYTRAAPLHVAPENPKVVSSAAFDRYERYKAAKTVGAYLDAGGTRSNLRGDWDKGHVTQVVPLTNDGDDTDDDFDELYAEVAAAPAAAPAADDWGSASFGMAAPAPAAPAPAAAPAAADDDDWGAASFGMAPAPPAATVTPPAPPAAHPLAPVEPPAPPPAPYVDADDWGTASFGMNTVPTARVVSAEVPANGDWGTVSLGMNRAAAPAAAPAAEEEDENWQTAFL